MRQRPVLAPRVSDGPVTLTLDGRLTRGPSVCLPISPRAEQGERSRRYSPEREEVRALLGSRNEARSHHPHPRPTHATDHTLLAENVFGLDPGGPPAQELLGGGGGGGRPRRRGERSGRARRRSHGAAETLLPLGRGAVETARPRASSSRPPARRPGGSSAQHRRQTRSRRARARHRTMTWRWLKRRRARAPPWTSSSIASTERPAQRSSRSPSATSSTSSPSRRRTCRRPRHARCTVRSQRT